eukprot:TRINITY_DN4659_c0_g1_i1.p1 TRINITY_DN4659_c0_g1~~TRINITY_DN4659_c0_g1_i1.p1  ORF type:complete len:181 (-),score=25.52 TRINITY_DN4659_c0_g1_i1:55-597(-)
MDIFSTLKNMKLRDLLTQAITFGLIVSSALMIWKSLVVISGSESPIVVVLSGSMEPAYQRGDLLFLYHSSKNIEIGEIIVFQIDGQAIPIVHRALSIHTRESGKQYILTKGDANQVHDRSLYNPGQDWLEARHILGRAYGHLPFVGIVTIIMNDYPYVKYAVIAALALSVILSKDSNEKL